MWHFFDPLAKGPRQHRVAAATGPETAGVARAAGAGTCARGDGGADTVVGTWDEVAAG